MLKLIVLTLIGSLVRAQDGKPDTDPAFHPIEEGFLMFPMLQKDYENWNSVGTSIFLKNKAVIAPDSGDLLRGFIHTTKPNPNKDAWVAHLEVDIGNEENSNLRGGGGIGVYYVRNVDEYSNVQANYYGYTNKFEGALISLNALLKDKRNVK